MLFLLVLLLHYVPPPVIRPLPSPSPRLSLKALSEIFNEFGHVDHYFKRMTSRRLPKGVVSEILENKPLMPASKHPVAWRKVIVISGAIPFLFASSSMIMLRFLISPKLFLALLPRKFTSAEVNRLMGVISFYKSPQCQRAYFFHVLLRKRPCGRHPPSFTICMHSSAHTLDLGSCSAIMHALQDTCS